MKRLEIPIKEYYADLNSFHQFLVFCIMKKVVESKKTIEISGIKKTLRTSKIFS